MAELKEEKIVVIGAHGGEDPDRATLPYGVRPVPTGERTVNGTGAGSSFLGEFPLFMSFPEDA